jgi:hypothetical protein
MLSRTMFDVLTWKTDRTQSGRKDPEDDIETSRACEVGKTGSPKQPFFKVMMSEAFGSGLHHLLMNTH